MKVLREMTDAQRDMRFLLALLALSSSPWVLFLVCAWSK